MNPPPSDLTLTRNVENDLMITSKKDMQTPKYKDESPQSFMAYKGWSNETAQMSEIERLLTKATIVSCKDSGTQICQRGLKVSDTSLGYRISVKARL
jgi:hypothetical protein